jgi:hypothetical protein
MMGRERARSFTVPGRAVQVDPIKPQSKPPGTERLKRNFEILVSTSAFKFSLRRYTLGHRGGR